MGSFWGRESSLAQRQKPQLHRSPTPQRPMAQQMSSRPPHKQLPAMHAPLTAQALPHRPQLESSAKVFTQRPPHTDCPKGQRHVPPAHDPPIAHALPHEPQLRASFWRLVHAVPHTVWPVGQRHMPPTQVWPVRQAVPHEPQLRASLCRSTHAPAHDVSPVEQPVPDTHAPLTHDCPAAHVRPQPPHASGLVKPKTSHPFALSPSQLP